MATLDAWLGISMDTADLNRLVRDFQTQEFSDDAYAIVSGDLFEGVYEAVYLLGYEFAFTSERAFGTATTYLESISVAGVWTPVLTIDGASFPADAFYQAALTTSTADDAALFSAILAGDDLIRLSAYDDQVRGGSGNDHFEARGGNDALDGGTGYDVSQYSGLANGYRVIVGPAAVEVVDRFGGEGSDTLVGFEEVQFEDRSIEMAWLSGAARASAAQFSDLTDMYIAYFDRAPDAVGLLYWASRLDDGMSLGEVARSFFVQPETLAVFPPGQTTEAFIADVYGNVLGREPDAAGLAYWASDLDAGRVSQDEFILAVIYGARAATGSPLDALYLANRNAVGRDFAVDEGLNNLAWARAVMQQVDGTAESVRAAAVAIDAYAGAAASDSPDLVVQIVGLAG